MLQMKMELLLFTMQVNNFPRIFREFSYFINIHPILFRLIYISFFWKILRIFLAMFGKHETLSLLINKGANPNIGNNRNTTPLHKAAQRGEIKCLQLLINASANINFQVTPKGN